MNKLMFVTRNSVIIATFSKSSQSECMEAAKKNYPDSPNTPDYKKYNGYSNNSEIFVYVGSGYVTLPDSGLIYNPADVLSFVTLPEYIPNNSAIKHLIFGVNDGQITSVVERKTREDVVSDAKDNTLIPGYFIDGVFYIFSDNKYVNLEDSDFEYSDEILIAELNK